MLRLRVVTLRPFLVNLPAAAICAVTGCNALLGLDDPTVIAASALDASDVRDARADGHAVEMPPDASEDVVTADDCRRSAGGTCGLVPQCGCTEKQTCDVTGGTGATSCTPAGLAKLGSACFSTSSCERGLTCVYGACHAFCEDAGALCAAPSGGPCRQVMNASAMPIPNLTICTVDCALDDPLACGGTSGSGTAACFVDSVGTTDCSRAGDGQVGDVCTSVSMCGAALVCVTRSGTDRCARWCRVGVDAACGSGTCTGFVTKVIVNGIEFGACPD